MLLYQYNYVLLTVLDQIGRNPFHRAVMPSALTYNGPMKVASNQCIDKISLFLVGSLLLTETQLPCDIRC